MVYYVSMAFICERCLTEFKQKVTLKGHLQRKCPCEAKASTKAPADILDELLTRKLADKAFACDHCTMEFSHRSGKSRHMKTCKSNPANKEMVSISKDEYIALKGTTIINNNNNNITNNTQNIIINVNNFGQEDFGHLFKRLEYYWQNKGRGLIEMTKDIHFDPNHPENHTFTISNQRARLAKVKEDGQWKPKSCDEAIDDIVYTISREIEQFIEEKADYLKHKFPRVVEGTNAWWDKVGTEQFDEKEYSKLVTRLVEMVVLHRHVVGAPNNKK